MGPLSGYKIIEFAAAGPVPFCGMLLSDMGATIIRIDRPNEVELGVKRPIQFELLRRGRRTIAIDLKDAASLELVLALVEKADGLIEGFRPGVMERLGLGPDVCQKRNPRLVYGRMTGWGQQGQLANSAGHDLNYIAITGVLNAVGRAGQPPSVPLAVAGDFGGGGAVLAIGVLAALLEASRSGKGQTIDAAIVDGSALLATSYFGAFAAGMWDNARGTNISDSGAFFYDVYECADGQYITVAALEERFFHQLLKLIGVDLADIGNRNDRQTWPKARGVLAAKFKTRTREQWSEVLEGSDACFAPVLNWSEAGRHPHIAERATIAEYFGVVQPSPAPRFSRTPSEISMPPQEISRANTEAALKEWFSDAELARFGAVDTDPRAASQSGGLQ